LSTVRRADFVDAVVSEILGHDLTDVVLVGHSLAGITLPGVAQRIPKRLRRLVFVSCAVPPHGLSVADVPGTLSPTVAELAQQLGEGIVDERGTLHPDFATAMFCNDMTTEQTSFTLSLLVPESIAVILEPVDLTGLNQGVATTYVRLLRDASLSLETQDRMASTAGADEVIDIDAGHMVMISSPDRLAAVLDQ
jgi:pimeloyl-ACP methyl ester carboxylesterase